MQGKTYITFAATLLALFALFTTITNTFTTDAAAAAGLSAPHEEIELGYIDLTLMHHDDGIKMAALAEGKAVSAAVKTFATKTREAQEKDKADLQEHRDRLFAGKPKMESMQMKAKRVTAVEMQAEAAQDMEKLQAASGTEFDRLFLETMKKHHKMAIDMSKAVIPKADHTEIKSFARMTVSKQTKEIAEMNNIQRTLGVKSAAMGRPGARR
jgi:uncharacterized protein (DUF305 family)